MIPAILTLWPLLLALLAALVIAARAWSLQPHPGSRSLAGMMLAVALWLASSLGEHAAPGSPAAFIWLGLFASLLAPVFWLAFAAGYTGRDAWLGRRSRLLLFAFPFLVLLVAWGNGAHHLLFDSLSLAQPEPYRVYSLRPGPAWLVAEIAGYLLVLAGGSLLAASLRRANRAGRERIPLLPLILLAALPPAVLRLLYLLGGGPFPGVDLAPVGAVVTGACLAYALARYDVSDLVPIAREAVIASMQDGVLVLDGAGQVAVINPAAQDMLGLDLGQVTGPGALGRPLAEALGSSSSALLPVLERDTTQAEVALGGVDEHGALWAEVRVSPLLDRRGRRTGRLVVLRDITEARRSRDELLEANRRLEMELAERRRVEEELRFASMHDALTGLYNRAYFEEEMQRLAEGRSYPVSIVMADTDRLKEINDRLGHATGDELLRQAAGVLRSVFRAQDVVARIGGDEFCILMPDTPLPSAMQTLDRIRARAAQVNVERPDLPLSLSLGAYTAEANESLAEAFRRADQLMYHNKQARKAGRDTRG